MRRRTRARGLTLLEIMIAVAIISMVSTMVWASFRQTMRTKTALESQAGRYRTVRIALERLAREMGMAYTSQHEDTSMPDRRTLFSGKKHSDLDEVRFSYFGHQRLYQDANEADTAQVYYYTARDPYDSRKTNLIRKESRRLQALKIDDQANEAAIACDDIVRFKLEYYDARDKLWREQWDTTTADGQPDRLPSKARITLVVVDERGTEVPFQTQVRIAMQEPLYLKAVDAVATSGSNTTTTASGTKTTTTTTTGSTSSTTSSTAAVTK